MRWDSAALLTSIRKRGYMPSSSTHTATDVTGLLADADEEVLAMVAGFLKGMHEDYLITSLDISVTGGTAGYRLPTRALGGAFRACAIVESDGTLTFLSKMRLQDRDGQSSASAKPWGRFLTWNTLNLWPTPDTSYTLRVFYETRPGQLVYPTACAPITAVNPGLSRVTLEYTPSAFGSSATVDTIRGKPIFEHLSIDKAVTISTNVATFTSYPTGVEVGDYLALAGQSPVPQLPPELHPLLAQRVACKYLRAKGDGERLKAGLAELEKLETEAAALFKPREGGEPEVISSDDPFYGMRAADARPFPSRR